jgi:hypothetical protein
VLRGLLCNLYKATDVQFGADCSLRYSDYCRRWFIDEFIIITRRCVDKIHVYQNLVPPIFRWKQQWNMKELSIKIHLPQYCFLLYDECLHSFISQDYSLITATSAPASNDSVLTSHAMRDCKPGPATGPFHTKRTSSLDSVISANQQFVCGKGLLIRH